jgi:hypothetical protein
MGKHAADSFSSRAARAIIMIIINNGILKTFVRLQLASGKNREETIKHVFKASHGLYQEVEIEDVVNDIYAERPGRNKEVIDKLLSMIKEFVIPDYEGINTDEDGLDEADRMMMEVIESVGTHGC